LPAVNVHHSFPGQDKKELLGSFVVVKDLGGSWGHLLLNHAELRVLD
jgi:hypothetical protein